MHDKPETVRSWRITCITSTEQRWPTWVARIGQPRSRRRSRPTGHAKRSGKAGALGTPKGNGIADRSLRAGTARFRFGETGSSTLLVLCEESCAHARSRPVPNGHAADRGTVAATRCQKRAVNPRSCRGSGQYRRRRFAGQPSADGRFPRWLRLGCLKLSPNLYLFTRHGLTGPHRGRRRV
jgi:hypothetical protein